METNSALFLKLNPGVGSIDRIRLGWKQISFDFEDGKVSHVGSIDRIRLGWKQ